MLFAEIQDEIRAHPTTVVLSLSLATLVLIARLLVIYSHEIPRNAPAVVTRNFPLTGTWAFWGSRWDFCRNARDRSVTGNYSFHAGKHHVIGLSGEKGRNVLFDNKEMDFGEG